MESKSKQSLEVVKKKALHHTPCVSGNCVSDLKPDKQEYH